MELCVQLAIIFVGKQFLLSVVEYHLPRIWKLYNTFKGIKHKRLINYCSCSNFRFRFPDSSRCG